MTTWNQGHGHQGSRPYDQCESFTGDPRIAPGFPRPIGWRVRDFDGSQAYDKVGPLDTDWAPVGDGSGGGSLAALYTAGLANPTVDNRLIGSYFSNYFTPEGSQEIEALVPDDGSGGNAHHALRLTRKFSNTAGRGLFVDYVSEYSPQADFGGGKDRWIIRDTNDGQDHVIVEEFNSYEFSVQPPGYYPAFSPIDSNTIRTLNMQRRPSLGGLLDSVWGFSADGTMQINPRLPNVTGAQTQALIYALGNREGGAMFPGQGFGLWIDGRDNFGFTASMGKMNATWIDPASAAPKAKWDFDVADSGSWRRGLSIDRYGLMPPPLAQGFARVAAYTFISAPINLATLGATVQVFPAVGAGAYAIGMVTRLQVDTRSIPVVTAPVWKVGTNAAHDNLGSGGFVSAANLNVFPAPFNLSAAAGVSSPVPTLELTAPLTLEITTAGTGAGAIDLMGRFVFTLIVTSQSLTL